MLFRREPILNSLGDEVGQRFLIDGDEVSEKVFVREFQDAKHVQGYPSKDWRDYWTSQLSPYPGPGPPVPWKVPPMTVPPAPPPKTEVISFAEFERRWNIGTGLDRARMLDQLVGRLLTIDVCTGTERVDEIVIEA